MNKVVVVIPTHKEQLSEHEAISLRRCANVLRNFDRILAVPECSNTAALETIDPDLVVLRFPDKWFASDEAYNLFCRDPSFYQSVSDYEYMLLYQVDCYVFRDDLLSWCEKGYDYIGAPWPHYEFRRDSRKWWTRSPFLTPFLRRVGNGGLSLRRVEVFERLSKRLRLWVRLTRHMKEDVFWCNLVPHLHPFLKIPSWKEAARFAIESDPGGCLDLNGGNLPFGIHGWNTDHLLFWESRIEELRSEA